MSENEFWVAVWKIIAVTLITITAIIASCSSYNTQKISEAKDPIAFRCGVSGGGDYGKDTAICLEKAKQQ